MISEELLQKADSNETLKADIPHNSENNFVFLGKLFEKFWSNYPQQKNKAGAWEEFKKLNPDEVLFSHLMDALNAQHQHYQNFKEAGKWVPAWKYPAKWLAQKCWNDELSPSTSQEKNHAKHERTYAKKSSFDLFWESCKRGADFNFGEDEYGLQ